MRTRSGQRPVEIEQEPPVRPRPLLKRYIRPNGADEPHSCLICLAVMYARQDSTPAWMQCPECNDVFHETCIRSWIARSDSFNCPNCNKTFQRSLIDEDLDAWTADQVLLRMQESEDEDFDSEDCDSDSDEDESSQSESESNDDSEGSSVEVR
eukprot:1984544-Prymnesium_polylepis.1